VRREVRLSRGAFLAVASAVSYGCLAVLAKLAYGEGWNVPSLLTARFLLAGLCVLPFALRDRSGSWKGWWSAFAVGAVGYAGTTALYFPSLARLPAAVASFLLYLSPPLVALLGVVLFRERVSPRAAAGMALALAGLALLSAGAFAGALSLAGIALAAGSAVVYAATVVASRHMTGHMPWPRSTLGVSAGAFASYLVFSLATRQLAVPPSARGALYVLGIGTLATGVALSLFMAALPRIGASRTALLSTLEPVSTLAIGAVVLREVPPLLGLVGCALILGAAVLVALEEPVVEPHE
jgi:drug/metabolite transporter (DMT)-like permease